VALSGRVERIIFENPETGYVVLLIRELDSGRSHVVVGHATAVRVGESVRATGTWRDDPRWGRQLAFDQLVLLLPDTPDSLLAYFEAGMIPGVGGAMARRLIDTFGRKLPAILDSEPERLREVKGIGAKLAARIGEKWQSQRRQRDLLVFLGEHGITGAKARDIWRSFGERAIARISADPYLLARKVRGIGFPTADQFAQKLGLSETAPARRMAAIEHVLTLASEAGHTALPQGRVLQQAAELLGQESHEQAEAIESAVSAGLVVRTGLEDGDYLQLAALAQAELDAASSLRRLARGTPPWAGMDAASALERAQAALGMALSPSQEEAIHAVLRTRLLVVTGGPGTGKTTLVRAVLAALEAAHIRVGLCAPTGRAARRLGESTEREARTIHRLLEAGVDRAFRRCRERRLDHDLIVCDETSMVDVQLLAALLDALPEHAALILVGDADQLPSVGPGQILADIIASDTVPVIRLTEIFRQAAASAIVRNAHAINQGRLPSFEPGEDGERDFYGIKVRNPEDALARLVELVAGRIPQRFGLDPLGDIQVLTPTNRGPLGTQALNMALAPRLNPAPRTPFPRNETGLAVGDKVMQIENDYERDVYNGDIGRVLAIDPERRALKVLMDGREVAYEGLQLDQLVPAFAITVHKAQGSEYPAIVLALMRQQGRMLQRRLLYTAITRAKRLVVILAEAEALERAVRDFGERRRISLLAFHLRFWSGPDDER
jgi:exodeoxyribonuclease V alpha subunit